MITINNEKEFCKYEIIENCKQSCNCNFNFNNYYKKICKSYSNMIDLLEQMEKDIPRLDVYLQNKKIKNLHELLCYLGQISNKLLKNNINNDIHIPKWFYLINQSVFGLNFYIMNKLYNNINEQIYVIDKSNSEKKIVLKFSNNQVQYELIHQFYIIQLTEQGHAKILHTIHCKLKIQCIHYEFPEYIHISWTIEDNF